MRNQGYVRRRPEKIPVKKIQKNCNSARQTRNGWKPMDAPLNTHVSIKDMNNSKVSSLYKRCR